MSTNKTQNYQLHSWAPEDEESLAELNANFTKLDTALKAEATARINAVNTLNTALAGKAAIVTGTYTGDGTKARVINLGFAPKAVFIIPPTGRLNNTYGYYGGLALSGNPLMVKEYEVAALTSTGFRVSYTIINHSNYDEIFSVNSKNSTYYYFAVQ